MKRSYASAFGAARTRPYKRRRKGGRYTGKYQAQYKAALARKANSRTGGFIGIELKFYDSFVTTTALTAPTDAAGGEFDESATICMTTIPNGAGESQRVGRQVTMKSLAIRGIISETFQINQTAGDITPTIMLAVIMDTQTNGATIVSENVFENPSANGLLACSVFRKIENARRYKTLATKTFKMPEIGAMAYDGTNIEQGGTMIPFAFYIDMKNTKINYSGTTETIVNTVDNSIHMIAYCTSTLYAPSIQYASRLRYVG